MPKPSLYDPTYIEKLDEYIGTTGREQMVLPTIEGFAKYLGVHRDTIYTWEKENPDFKQALDQIRSDQKEQLMNDGLYGGKEVNSTMAIFLLKVNHNMIEKNALDFTTDGKPLVGFDLHGKNTDQSTDKSTS